MARSPPASPSKVLAAKLLIAKSKSHGKKAKKAATAKPTKTKSRAKENQMPAAAGRKARSILIS
jgi:hypothetical protein